ncbi:hypothetical protein C943_00963 [Mariniradius saccharolyticus AK6]|uniref:Uncharacterized protein n=1 Tax=Mariniradius saccharolyticus AK6 TaxID=1239962 RepID=M7X571_9BACT|nr:hypothetical protein C943_00963 [Mariniradius saccharolyticus AK6]
MAQFLSVVFCKASVKSIPLVLVGSPMCVEKRGKKVPQKETLFGI